MEFARREVFDSLEVKKLMKVVLRSAFMVSGEWCVLVDGILLMLKWFADSWGFQKMVRNEG